MMKWHWHSILHTQSTVHINLNSIRNGLRENPRSVSASIRINQHQASTSIYFINQSINQHWPESISTNQHQSALISINQNQSASISINQHQSESISIKKTMFTGIHAQISMGENLKFYITKASSCIAIELLSELLNKSWQTFCKAKHWAGSARDSVDATIEALAGKLSIKGARQQGVGDGSHTLLVATFLGLHHCSSE